MEKRIAVYILVAFLLAMLASAYAIDTNVSIFYGWNGSTFMPVLTDASGKLQTDFNITTSVGMNPKVNNTINLGSLTRLWANIYTSSVRSGSTLSLFSGSTEAITILANGFVGIGVLNPTDRLMINGNISFVNGPKIIDDNGKLKLQAGGAVNGSTSSIYFLDSGGVVRGRFEMNYSSTSFTNTFTDTSQTDFNTGMYNNTNTSGTGVDTNLTLALFNATGGTITYSGGYTIHTFTTNGTFNVTGAGNVEYLVVGGGGGGGNGYAGGGGAGGYRTGNLSVTAQAYTITVGTGGPQGIGDGPGSEGSKGGNSVFSTITSNGGGGGGGRWLSGNGPPPTTGGSGGGGAASYTTGGSTSQMNGAAGNTPSTSPSQGNAGGNGAPLTGDAALLAGGGGGGSSGAGANAGTSGQGGNGGAGTSNSISGSAVTYATGGGGSGNFGAGPNGIPSTAGAANTGNGGTGANGEDGGSGIVIIRYLTSTYLNSGNFTSRVFDANQTVTWSTIFWSNVTPTGTAIILRTRTSANNVTFTDWMNHTTSPSSITQNPSNRYLQYQVQMNTTDVSVTPSLLNVSVSYSYSTASSNNTYGTLYVGTTNTAAADLAEYYATGELLEAGDVVSVSNEKLTLNGHEITTRGVLRKSSGAYDKNILGAISTTPGLILGSYDPEGKSLLALAGRTPVKVSAENGPIDIGDYLTSSSQPGIAMKATQPGMVIGRALEIAEGALGKIEVLIGTKESNFIDDISTRQEQIDALSQQNQQIQERITVLEAIIRSNKG